MDFIQMIRIYYDESGLPVNIVRGPVWLFQSSLPYVEVETLPPGKFTVNVETKEIVPLNNQN